LRNKYEIYTTRIRHRDWQFTPKGWIKRASNGLTGQLVCGAEYWRREACG